MSVMACDRKGCDNVMCDNLILGGSAYICKECLSELTEEKELWPKEMMRYEVKDKIRAFMDSEKSYHGAAEELDEHEISKEFWKQLGAPYE